MIQELDTFQESWANEPKYKDLNGDVEAASGTQEDVRKKLDYYKLLKDGGKPVKVKPGKSKTLPKLVRKAQEWKYADVEEPFLSNENLFSIKPNTEEDVTSSHQNGSLLNYQYNNKIGKVRLVNTISRTYVDEGSVIVRTGWTAEYGTKVVEKERPTWANPEESLQMMQQAIEAGEMSREEAEVMLQNGQPMQTGTEKYYEEEETLVKNQPKHTVCDTANVTIDPKCEGDLSKAGFVAYEYDTSWAELAADEYQEFEDGSTRGFYKNIEIALASDGDVAYDEHKPDAYNDFKYSDKARKKVKAVEYWGYWDIQGNGKLVAIVAEWVNGVMVRLEENPYPHKRIPFSMAVYMPVLRNTHGEPDANLLADNQNTIGNMQRAMEDITTTAAIGQEFIDNQFFGSPAMKNQYEKGNTVYYQTGMDPKRSIHRRTVDPIDRSIFQIIEANTDEAESLSGTQTTSAPSGGSVFKDKQSLSAVAKRNSGVLRRLSAMFVDMARMVVSMNQAYLSEEEVIRLTNDEFVTIRRDDLEGNFDLRINIATKEADEESANDLAMILQTGQQTMKPEMVDKIWAKICRLKGLEDLAEDFENNDYTPDPMKVEMQKLQIEKLRLDNEKLKADMLNVHSQVTDRNSRSIENGYDSQNKLAQAELRLAQAEMNIALKEKYLAEAEEASSRADKLDQETIDIADGVSREHAVNDLVYSETMKTERDMLKKSSGDN